MSKLQGALKWWETNRRLVPLSHEGQQAMVEIVDAARREADVDEMVTNASTAIKASFGSRFVGEFWQESSDEVAAVAIHAALGIKEGTK